MEERPPPNRGRDAFLLTLRACERLGMTTGEFSRLRRREAMAWLCREEFEQIRQRERDKEEAARWRLLLKCQGVKFGAGT